MLYPMPPNVIPFLLVGVSTLFFGIKSLLLFRKSHNSLSLYFGLTGIFIGIGTLLNSLPYIFTNQEFPLKICIVIADSFLYAAVLLQTRLIWYYNNKKYSYLWYFVPVFVLIIIIEGLYIITFSQNSFTYVNNFAYVPVNPFVGWLSALACLTFVVTGIYTVLRANDIGYSHQRIRLYVLGFAFMLGGIIASYNYAALQGVNNSYSIIGYTVAAVLLLIAVFAISRRKVTNK